MIGLPQGVPQIPLDLGEILDELKGIRRRVEARGIDVSGRLKALGIEDEILFDDPWTQAQPAASKRKAAPPRRK